MMCIIKKIFHVSKHTYGAHRLLVLVVDGECQVEECAQAA